MSIESYAAGTNDDKTLDYRCEVQSSHKVVSGGSMAAVGLGEIGQGIVASLMC